jgi:nucleotide-binding universal stress UspA family protein
MFQKILVAVDNSAMSQQIFEQALFLAKATAGNLLLLHVLSSEEEGYPEMTFFSSPNYYSPVSDEIIKDYLEQLETFKERSLNVLRSRKDQATAVGINAEISQISGTPSHAICDVAGSWGADLIVMGRRGLLGLKEAVLGSVSNYVTHHAPCSVLTVHHSVNTETKTKILEENQADSSRLRAQRESDAPTRAC